MSGSESESDDAVGRREVAWRVFAAEFDDADFSYAESDEERAPNYVVTPTGARVNRMFVVGVLTEVEQVSDDVLRARIVDPTGAFVVYAGQYQPDALAFLESADVPAFVAVTGKARTFQPEDSDLVYTSVRPESINAVDAETRDRWTVRTAEQTVERVGTMADALDSEERGETLRDALVASGVRPDLAAGVPLAIDHYGTTETYLEAVCDLSVEAAEVVAGERDEVSGLDVAPAEGGPVDVDLGAGLDFGAAAEPETAEPEPEPEEVTAEATGEVSAEADETEAASATDASASEPSEVGAETEAETEPETEPETETEAPEESAASVETETEFEFETESEEAEAEGESEAEAEPEPAETAEAVDSTESAETTESAESAESGTLGDFEPSTDSTESAEGEAGVEDEAEVEATDEMYELSEEERQEVEEEFDVGFSSGNEVPDAGETDIEPEAAPEAGTEAESETEPDVEDSEETVEETTAAFEEEVESEPTTEESEATAAAGLDNLEDTVIDVMEELDEGDGADHDDLVATIVERYDVSQDEVADAIQSALMSGRCYESGEDNLKAI